MRRTSVNEVVKLTDVQKKKIIEEIRSFYYDVRGDEIGIIEQQQILNLFLEHLAPIVYNKALDDAQRWYRQQQDNLESDYYLLYRDIH